MMKHKSTHADVIDFTNLGRLGIENGAGDTAYGWCEFIENVIRLVRFAG